MKVIGLIGTMVMSAALAPAVEAREFRFQKKVVPHVLQNELQAAGFRVTHITCVDDACMVVMPDAEKKDPAPVVDRYVFRDPMAGRTERRAKLRSFLKALRERTISSEERDSLLEALVAEVLAEEVPPKSR